MDYAGQILVTVHGEPVAQGRPRAFRAPGGHIRAYDPPKSRNWKAEAHECMVRAVEECSGMRVAYPLGACDVKVIAVFSCPRSDNRKIPRLRRRHAKRPDAENVAKAVLDAGTGVLWADDSQVARLVIEKWIAAQGERPFIAITVRGFDGDA